MKVDSVPWSTKEEWKTVYRWLYSQDPKLQEKGLCRITAWKERGCGIPTGIDVTAIIVRAILASTNFKSGETDEYIERSIFSTAITEFISYAYAHAYLQYGKLSNTEAAKKMNIPSWLLALRHQSAHGVRSSLSLLRRAAIFALDWIRMYYWEEKMKTMQDVYANSIASIKYGDFSEENVEDIRSVISNFKQAKFQFLSSATKQSLSKIKEAELAVNAKISCDSSACATVLCEEEYLFMGLNKLVQLARQRGSNESSEKILIDFWSPLFVSFIKYQKANCLLQRLIHKLVSSNVHNSDRAVLWIKLLVKNIKKDENIEWKNVLKTLLDDPNKAILEVLECILDKSPAGLDEKEKEDILSLTKIYLGTDTDEDQEMQTESDSEARIYTVDDLRTLENDETQVAWRIATDIDWYDVPIGAIMVNGKRIVPSDCNDMSSLLQYSDIFVPTTSQELDDTSSN